MAKSCRRRFKNSIITTVCYKFADETNYGINRVLVYIQTVRFIALLYYYPKIELVISFY